MSDDGLFREVDEEVRREQLGKIWNRFGNLILAVCFVIVAGVGGMKAWQYWQAKQAEAAGMQWYQAAVLASQGKSDEADAAFDKIAESGHHGYALLARLAKAARLGQDGKTSEALAIYDSVAADSAADEPLRNLARVRAAYLLVDTASVDELTQRLQGLDAATSSWRHAWREIIALAHIRAGNSAEANDLVLQILADPQTPAALRSRMQLVSAQLQPLLSTQN